MARLPAGVPLFDADGALSREYLLHRGYCCKNGCRNCPYGFVKRATRGDTAIPASEDNYPARELPADSQPPSEP